MSIRIAIVGTGKVARGSYLGYLSGQEDVALTYYNRTRSKAKECASEFGGRVASSIEEVLAGAPDAILVLTREMQRYEAARDLLRGRPKRLFFEKPLVAQHGQDQVCEDDFAKGAELLRRAGEAGTETAMVFNYRLFEQTMSMQQVVAVARERMPVEERAIPLEELSAADEVLTSGSARGLVPIVAIDGRPVGDGTVGPHARALFAALAARVDAYVAARRGGAATGA